MTAQDEQMAGLHRRFLLEAETDCAVCRRAIEEEDFELLRRSAHRLAGRGGMFATGSQQGRGNLEDALLAGAERDTVTSLGGELLSCLQQLNQGQPGAGE
jgi:HPt (histidine-containing phosphotransfer) domain-containing protein